MISLPMIWHELGKILVGEYLIQCTINIHTCRCHGTKLQRSTWQGNTRGSVRDGIESAADLASHAARELCNDLHDDSFVYGVVLRDSCLRNEQELFAIVFDHARRATNTLINMVSAAPPRITRIRTMALGTLGEGGGAGYGVGRPK